MRRPAPLLAALAVALAITGCGSQPSEPTDSSPIKIGQIVSLTGNYAALGTENQKSVALAVEQINTKGGVLGRKIELSVKDDKSQPDQSVLAFNELKGSGVTAIIGSPFSNSALATIPQVDRAEIPYVSLTPADEQVNPIHPYVFVVPALSGTYAERILQYFKAVGYTKIAVAHDAKSSYAVAGFKGFQDKAAKYGVSLVATPEFQTTATEFSGVFNAATAAKPDALVVWATGAPAVALAKQYAALGLTLPLVMTGAQASKLWLEPVGAAAKGITVASAVGVVGSSLPAGPLKSAIEELAGPFQSKYGYAPPQFAQDGYSGVKLLAAAIEKAQSTAPDKIKAAFESLTLTTPNGKYTYSPTDHSGLTADYISINTVQDGAFVPTDWAKQQLATIAAK